MPRELDFREGSWLAARAHAAEAAQLAEETQQATGFARDALARVEAAAGRADQARTHAQAALDDADAGSRALTVYARAALGLLALGEDDARAAVEALDTTAQVTAELGWLEPNVVQWEPDLIEAHVRAGQPDAAGRALGRFERRAANTQRPWALAAAARCSALLAPTGEIDDAFAEAMRRHELTPSPFERARTELCWGERLRRDGRRVEARRRLRSALATFQALGADPWERQALRELRASGERARRGERARSDELTPQETQVAMLVADGATNKEVAARLFLSPKTVEFHLGHVFRKLGVRNRSELAGLLLKPSARPPVVHGDV